MQFVVKKVILLPLQKNIRFQIEYKLKKHKKPFTDNQEGLLK